MKNMEQLCEKAGGLSRTRTANLLIKRKISHLRGLPLILKAEPLIYMLRILAVSGGFDHKKGGFRDAISNRLGVR
jgi:hypothetical protein